MKENWRPYVPVAARRERAARQMETLRRRGHPVAPVTVAGRAIATTFWGKSWCENLERYSDFANRLPRGRTYVRNGSVLDLQIAPGEVRALVIGSELYEVQVSVSAVPKALWTAIAKDCSGRIDSLVELLQGRLSRGVMERICREETGLFPSPREIRFDCSCPDWAAMCKHVAAVLYGIGTRLDEKPALLFALRKVDEKALIARAGESFPLAQKGLGAEKVLGDAGLSEIFGIEISEVSPAARNRRGSATNGPKPRKAKAGGRRPPGVRSRRRRARTPR
jgi:hypothetical protein